VEFIFQGVENQYLDLSSSQVVFHKFLKLDYVEALLA